MLDSAIGVPLVLVQRGTESLVLLDELVGAQLPQIS
ncbi:hypothetical protein Pr1d_20530 [Bythopirellula goksoeyrii]|uniref:Uncharacterized protein n=1 Tax=Bythopirellula goksoeyrii TaxID=1400387 RepID=A0A5B9QAJ5_9BACT|nr:hypothetical protein Pr1d_20530 [Bythopirellula goksoeyrii]